MIILVINSGSSSLKYQLINMKNEVALVKGICEKIGSEISTIRHEIFDGRLIEKKLYNIKTHKQAFNYIINLFLDIKCGVIKELSEISAIGHRVVHGGKYFESSALINDEVVNKIKDLIALAPLHNQVNLETILICKKIFSSKITQVAVFDTSFYSEIPPKAYMFAIPYEYYEKYSIKKYGFHGMSHKYVSEKCAEIVGRNLSDLKIITCHLGNGSSITAIDRGKVIDTSMGLTPIGGIMMGTRCGSLDPSIVTLIGEKEQLSVSQISEVLNKKSGLLGISGVSNDDREIIEAIDNGNKRAILAHEMMDYQIIKYIGAYAAAMNGCDAIVFTAGIGENQWCHRKVICENLSFMGINLDQELNEKAILGVQGRISSKDSKVGVFVIGTNEELVIARETKLCMEKQVVFNAD